MTGFQWFVLGFIIIACLGYWNWKKSGEQIKALQANGFTITDDLKGSPKLLIDRTQQSIAVVSASEYRLYYFDQIVDAEYLYESQREVETDHRIELTIQAGHKSKEVIKYADEWSAEDQFKRLQTLLR